jgi:hypothetical protein
MRPWVHSPALKKKEGEEEAERKGRGGGSLLQSSMSFSSTIAIVLGKPQGVGSSVSQTGPNLWQSFVNNLPGSDKEPWQVAFLG